jgi:hypothetical protein
MLWMIWQKAIALSKFKALKENAIFRLSKVRSKDYQSDRSLKYIADKIKINQY